MAFTGIFLFAVWQRWSLLPIAVGDPDTWGYIGPSLKLLSGAGFVQEGGRDWVYSSFVAGVLQLTGSMAGLVRIQQAMGLLAGMMMWLALRNWARFLPATTLREVAMAVIGSIVVCLYLWRPHTFLAEMQLRPEAIWSFFIFAQALCVLGYCRERWVRHRLLAALAFATGICLLAYINMLLRPSWGLATPLAMLPVMIGIIGPRAGRMVRVLTPVVAVVITVFFLWLPPKFFFTRDLRSENRLPLALFTIHAKWILEHFELKAKNAPAGSLEREADERLVHALQKEFSAMSADVGVYYQLGFDADYLQYRSPFFDWLQKDRRLTEGELNAFLLWSYFDAWRSRPLGMVGKIGTQFRHFVFPDYATFYKRGTDYDKEYKETLEDLPLEPKGLSQSMSDLYAVYLSKARGAASQDLQVEPILFLQKIARVIAGGSLVVFLVFAGLLVMVCLRSALSDLRLAGFIALLLYAMVSAHALTISIIHALDVNRYRLSYSGPLLLALAVMAVFCVVTTPRVMRLGRQP